MSNAMKNSKISMSQTMSSQKPLSDQLCMKARLYILGRGDVSIGAEGAIASTVIEE